MTNENLLPFDPNKVPDLIKQGKVKVITAPLPPIVEPIGGIRSNEQAKQLFGEDFLGEEAIHIMEQKCQVKGINVTFEIPQIGSFDSNAFRFGLSDEILETAKADEATGRARMVVLRPEFMTVDGERKPVTLLNLRDLFRKEEQDPDDANEIIVTDNNPFSDGAGEAIFYDQDWYDDEEFAKQPLRPGFGLPTKEVIDDSLSKKWGEQQALLLPEERRREPVEVAWDAILYYAATGKKVLKQTWDWTGQRASNGGLVYVGGFGSDGLGVRYWNPGNAGGGIGVCPAR